MISFAIRVCMFVLVVLTKLSRYIEDIQIYEMNMPFISWSEA